MKNFKLYGQSKDHPGELNARTMILPIVFCLVCGVLLIVLGNLALRITAYALAGILVVGGIWLLIGYIRSTPMERITESKLAIALIMLVTGILLAFKPGYLKEVLPFVWGLALLFGGFLKIQYAFDEKSVKVEKWWIMLILAGFSIMIGVLSLLDPAFLGDSRELVIGILLVAEAVLDITVYFLLKNALRKQNVVPIPGQAAAAPVPETQAAPVQAAPAVPVQAVPVAPAAPVQAAPEGEGEDPSQPTA